MRCFSELRVACRDLAARTKVDCLIALKTLGDCLTFKCCSGCTPGGCTSCFKPCCSGGCTDSIKPCCMQDPPTDEDKREPKPGPGHRPRQTQRPEGEEGQELLGFEEGQNRRIELQSAGLQVDVSLAGWPSKTSLRELSAVHATPECLFVALFDWHGTPAAASFSAQTVVKVFSDLLASSGSLRQAMEQVYPTLHTQFLASKDFSDEEKTFSGASGCLLAMDPKTGKIYAARAGAAGAAVGMLLHGLATQFTEGLFLHRPKSPLNGLTPEALAEADRSTCIGSCSGKAPSARGEGRSFMYHLEELPATVYHEHIILGSAGLWQNVTADDAALRSHFYVKATARGLGSREVQSCRTPVASQLVRYAQAKGNRRPDEKHRMAEPADITSIVLTLKWPATSFNQAFPKTEGFFNSLAQQMENASGEIQKPARLHWRKVRMLYIEFARARRHLLRRKWLDVVAGAVNQAKAAARRLEEKYWTKHRAAVKVTLSGQVLDSNGKVFMPIRLNAKAA